MNCKRVHSAPFHCFGSKEVFCRRRKSGARSRCFLASKALCGVGMGTSSNRVTAITVHEHDTGKFGKLFRFMYMSDKLSSRQS